jgi:HD superfamily phosphohydrolase
MKFSDILYGTIDIPDWLIPFLKIPEFVRLRGIRLSNVDSYEFKDFNGPTRWEHCIGVAHLAFKLAKKKKFNTNQTIHLVLAALLHDVATPPFAHTIEYVLEGYDHEIESYNILKASNSQHSNPSLPIFASQLPQFRNLCAITEKKLKASINPDLVAEMVTGGSDHGFFINGSIDLDNIDNVTRACIYLGIEVDKSIPLKLVDWLAKFDDTPTDSDMFDEQCVKEWLRYKNLMYGKFYSSSEEELGRQAFLQHLIRRAHNEGLSRHSILWNTDEALLSTIHDLDSKYDQEVAKNIFSYPSSLRELVQRYRLLESPMKVVEIPIEDLGVFKQIKNPAFADWLEQEMITSTFEPFVIVNAKRFNKENLLFNKGVGVIQIYKLGSMEIKKGQLSTIMLDANIEINIKNNINSLIKRHIDNSLQIKPWLSLTSYRKENIKANLDNIGNWSFRLSRNESLHSYPATFVHAIPASLITALGLKGETILDPFGGSGQTAMEAIKLGCKAISSDSNKIASLISRVKFSYIGQSEIKKSLAITEFDLYNNESGPIPDFNNIKKWHHELTIEELCKIKAYIQSETNVILKDFYTLCFSDILTSCTARKGKEHGYFADNTPLAKDNVSPPYENAFKHFISKVQKNIKVIEKSYSFFERNEMDTFEELQNCNIYQKDISKSTYSDFFIAPSSISGVITSPPYLCMADYTLGQRLSYNWLFPEDLKIDFENEIGSRRSRMQNEAALISYLNKMRLFARNCSGMIKENGFLATVIGAPLATNFKNREILGQLDKIFIEEGFEPFWQTFRPISWHRNHGYARLKEERIAVHIKK